MIMGLLWGTKKAQKRAPKAKNKLSFFHCGYKNAWNSFKFDMEVPNYCNYPHAKFCGPPQMAS